MVNSVTKWATLEETEKMTLDTLLISLKKLSIMLKLKDGQIEVRKTMLTHALRQAIIAHKPQLIRHLQAERIPAAAPTATERRIPGAIRLQYTLDWFQSETLKIPAIERGRQKARFAPPSRCRWLLDWLPKATRIELEAKGDLPWVDWNSVMGEVRGRFERDCGQ